MCLPLFESLENCTNNLCNNMNNLYNDANNLCVTIMNNINNTKRQTYTETSKKITRSHSDSNIKYSNINNPDSWEMLQIRLV